MDPALLDAADVLVSPRSRGTNTPLKIYQYLRSGPRHRRDVRLLTHTQVLDDSVSILTPATADGFAAGILRAGPSRRDRASRRRGGDAGRDEVQLRGLPGADARSGRPSRARGAGRRVRKRSVTANGSTPGVKSDHYSYTVYADPAMADSFDQARFGGPIGSLQAEIQARVIAEFAGVLTGKTALDVGTGTGRAALIMAGAGAAVTAIDASAEMLRVARARAGHRHAGIRFEVGDAHHLAHPDGAFDVAVGLRVLMHTPGWRRCVAELCRVARQRVIVDFGHWKRSVDPVGHAPDRGRGRQEGRGPIACSPRRRFVVSSRPTAIASRTSTASSSCPSRFTSASARAPYRGARRRTRASAGVLRLAARRVTMLAER
jgi:SAM-dependent methyltransferase